MSRFMVQTIRFSFLVAALLVIGAAEPGALAQPGDTGGGTVYFHDSATPYTWSMNSDGSNVTQLGNWTTHRVPSRDLHNGYRWYLTVLTIPGSYEGPDYEGPNGEPPTPRTAVFAIREDYDPNNSDTKVQLTNDATLQPFFPWHRFVEWAPGDQAISFKARRWEETMPGEERTPVEGGLYTADLVYRADGNIIGLADLPTTPTLEFPLDADGMPILGTHSWDDTGTRVVYNDDSGTGSTGLWVADLVGGTQTQIFWGLARDPDWSPDGTKIAFSRSQRIYTISPDGTGLQEIISPTCVGRAWCDCFGYPYFSPTGSHIVCIGWAQYNKNMGSNEVFRASYSGGDLTNLMQSRDVSEFPLGWREEALPPPKPGITVTPIEGLVTTEVGGTDTFDVVLDTQPAADVTIDLSSSDLSEGTVEPVTLVFTAADWDVPQQVIVTGVDDAIVDGNITYSIVTAPAVSADPDYNGLDAADVSVTNVDDDAAGVNVSSIDPDSMDAGTTIDVTITGTGFQAGATVTFENGTGAAPTADATSVNSTTIEATVTAHKNAKAAAWDVRVTNPDDSSGALIHGFTVMQ